MKLNPFAIVFWVFCALIGYLIDADKGAVIGAVSAMSVSFALDLIDHFFWS